MMCHQIIQLFTYCGTLTPTNGDNCITVNKIIVFGNILLRWYKCRRHEKVSNKVIIGYEINVEQSQNVHCT
jgi:hypothetical protein